ncbi:MAG: DNA replication/repair protein RecF [Opitutales bacterium]
MRLLNLGLENFRNLAAAQLPAEGADVYLVGANAQGKTNLLEAASLVSALRSFRTADMKALPRYGQARTRLFFRIEHELEGETEVLIELGLGHKQVEVGGAPVPRLADFLGRFPAVVLSSADIQLLRAGPAGRRRWLDLTLASRDPDYFRALTRYTRALRDRNRLLKERAAPAALAAFEAPLAESGAVLISARRRELAVLGEQFAGHHAELAGGVDEPALVYRPSRAWESSEAAAESLAQQRERDIAVGTTSGGPHRDDLGLTVGGRLAREYGSEGQQRSLVLALKLAEVDYLAAGNRPRPILLADDVLGELDAQRSAAFWRSLDPATQLIATGTRKPESEARSWRYFQVEAGTLRPA